MEKSLAVSSTTLLLLKLLEEQDLYGYQMIKALAARSDHTFELKAGTLYPLLKGLEEKGFLTSYEQATKENRTRKYYHLTQAGHTALQQKRAEWEDFSAAVNQVLKGGKQHVCLG